MITVEQAQEHFPIGARVVHCYLDRTGTVAIRPPGALHAGQVYSADVSGWCCSINVDWDKIGPLWTNTGDLVKLTDHPVPNVMKAFEEGMAAFGKGLAQIQRVGQATGAMGWVYRGDLDGARAALAKMDPEQLREVSAAAAALASLADEALTEADRG